MTATAQVVHLPEQPEAYNAMRDLREFIRTTELTDKWGMTNAWALTVPQEHHVTALVQLAAHAVPMILANGQRTAISYQPAAFSDSRLGPPIAVKQSPMPSSKNQEIRNALSDGSLRQWQKLISNRVSVGGNQSAPFGDCNETQIRWMIEERLRVAAGATRGARRLDSVLKAMQRRKVEAVRELPPALLLEAMTK